MKPNKVIYSKTAEHFLLGGFCYIAYILLIVLYK